MSKLYFSFSAMNAGKSAILLQSAYNYEERGMNTLLLKPHIDSRGDKADHIVSRIGLNAKANVFMPSYNLETQIVSGHAKTPIHCVFVDEAQFMTPEQVWQLSRVADNQKIPVMCYGLRTDFKGDLFPGSATLLAIADDVREIKTLCWCGRKATMTLRYDSDSGAITEGAQVDIGGNDKYVSLCRKHWAAQEVAPKHSA